MPGRVKRFSVSAKCCDIVNSHYQQFFPQRRKGAKKDVKFFFAPLRLCGKNLCVIVVLLAIAPQFLVFAQTNTGAGDSPFAEAEKLRSEQREAANQRAVEKYREAAALFQRGREFQRAAVALRNAGEILQLFGNSAEALTCYQQASTLNARSKNLVEQAKLLNDLAHLHFVDGNNKDAERDSRAAFDLSRTLGNREIEAEALNNLGEALYYSLNDSVKAQEHEQQSLAIFRELNNLRGQAISSISLGYIYKNTGAPEKALRSFSEALSLARQTNDLAIETQAHIALGNISHRTGNNQSGLESYTAAKKIAERIGDQTSQAMVLGGMGTIYLEMGDEHQAFQYMDEGTKLLERNRKTWGAAEGKLQLGRIRHSMGMNAEAVQYLTEALTLFKTLQMPQLQAMVQREMGLIYASVGDTSKALDSYKNALSLMRANEYQREAAYLLTYIGKIHEELKETDRAAQYYRDALPLSQQSSDPAGEALIRNNLAHLERDRGNLSQAKQHLEAALAIVESQRTKVLSQDLRTSYFATVRNTYELYIDTLMQLHKQNPGSDFDKEAFGISEKARARSFLELLSAGPVNARDGVDPALLAKERELSEAINTKAQLQVQLLTAKQSAEADKLCKELDTLVTELAQVRDKIRQATPRSATLSVPELLSLDEVQQRLLDNDTVMLEYVLGDDRSYVWVVTRTTSASYELPARTVIETAARKLHDLIASRQMIYGESTAERTARQAKADADIPGQIAALSKLILGPLAGKLDKKRLLVVADGALQYIPFQMLAAPDTGSYLIQTYEIVNSPSASILAVLQAAAANRKPALNSIAVLADPVFEIDDPRVGLHLASIAPRTSDANDIHQALRDAGISPDGQIPRLIGSGAEADQIMATAPWRTALKAVGFAANRERVLGSELANYRIIHFATHGIINSERPELSGIVLSLFDREGRSQNGFLRLHDIYNLHLPADLVVLSACSTGLGKDVRGEGLIGLTRGFMYAGASGVIASLWKVDDDATAELMKHFYEALFQKSMAPPAALRYAQLTLSQNKRWESPYYWAGFVIQGRYTETQKFNEPFPNRTQLALLAGAGGLLLLALIFILRKRRRHV